MITMDMAGILCLFLLDISWLSPRLASFCLFVCFIFVLICVIEWLVLISHCSHTFTPPPLLPVAVPAPFAAFVLCNHKCSVAHAAYAQCARLPLIELSSAWPSDQVTNCLDFNFSSSFSRAQWGGRQWGKGGDSGVHFKGESIYPSRI